MSISIPHRDYTAMQPVWEDLRNAYIGELAVKGAMPHTRLDARGWTEPGMRYLPRPAGMRESGQYWTYLNGASWTPATERAAHGITGSIFRHEPHLEVPTAIEPDLADITQTGVSLRMFAEQVVLETLVMGRFGLLVDFPGPVLAQDGQLMPPPSQSRPYWVGYKTEEIINWRTTRRGGDTILSLVVCKEVVEDVQGPWGTPDFYLTKPRVQYRELRLNESGVFEVNLWSELTDERAMQPAQVILQQSWIPTRQGQPLDFIPFVFLSPFSLEPTIQKSLLEGLIRRNFVNFRHSAEIEWARFLTAMPTLYVAANMEEPPEFYVGGSHALFLPDNQAKVGMVEFHGHGLGPLENALKEDMQMMAALGARLLEGQPEVQETAAGVNWRMAGSDSPVQALVSVVSQGLTWALQVHGWWSGLTDNIDDPAFTMALNKDLVSTTMEPQMLTALVGALLSGAMSRETYDYNLHRGELGRPGVSTEEEWALIDDQQAQRALVTAPLTPGTTPPGRNGARQAV
jgi:hypothetical protein